MQFQLGWRNIWRNPRRTLVILTAVVIGVWSMVFLGAMMRGIADQLLKNGISTLTGHIQVHAEGFRDDPVIQNSIGDPEKIRLALDRVLPKGAFWTERIRVNGIASNARHATGITLLGINPKKEAQVSFIGKAVTEGRYLEPDDEYGILVGKALLEDFDTKIGRRIVLMSRDTEGEVASRAFRIQGIFDAEMEATEKQFVFVTMKAARDLLAFKKGVSEVAVLLPKHGQTLGVAHNLSAELQTATLSISTWQELLPMVRVILRLYDSFILIWFIVVFIAMAFGIVNTLLMAVFERIREFGLLKALGMKPGGIIRGVLTESFLLLVLGTAAGNALGIISIFLLSKNGIDLSALAAGLEYVGLPRVIFPEVKALDFLYANSVVLVLGLGVSLYPALKAAGFTPVEALAHN